MYVSIPTDPEKESIEKVQESIVQVAVIVNKLKLFYPSARAATMAQYCPEHIRDKDKIISEGLFQKKLEVMLLQDEERRKK